MTSSHLSAAVHINAAAHFYKQQPPCRALHVFFVYGWHGADTPMRCVVNCSIVALVQRLGFYLPVLAAVKR